MISIAVGLKLSVEWEKTFGGDSAEEAWAVQQTSDGGYIIVGTTYSFGNGKSDVYLIKIDARGNLEWQRTFGGSRSDCAYAVQQTSDGGYIIAGWTQSFGWDKAYLIKVDANGNLEWERVFGGENGAVARAVRQTADGGYIVAGWIDLCEDGCHVDVYLIKVDKNGNLEWQRIFGGRGDDLAEDVQQTSDGGYIIVGRTTSFEDSDGDIYLIKTDKNGKLKWEKTFGGKHIDEAHAIQQTSDGGYIIAGFTYSFGKDGNAYIVKTDANGNLEWQRTLGGSDYDAAWSIQQTSDGGYVIAGTTASYGNGHFDSYLIKTDAKGNIEWIRTFGGSDYDVARSVWQTSDGGYIIAGYTKSFGRSDVYVIKLSPEKKQTPGFDVIVSILTVLIALIVKKLKC